jgi:ParB family transcriptional regulator, chromosome partitioning protein
MTNAKLMTANQYPISQIDDIPLEDIRISDDNVRLHDPEKDLEQLAESIRLHGLLQPVVLVGAKGSPPYDLISGQRRFLAHQKILKYATIRATFVPRMSRTDAIIRSLVENLQRTELEYRDTSEAITELYKALGSDRRVSEATGLSIRRVRDHLLVEARASQKMKDLLAANSVSPADIKRCLQAAQDNIQKAERLLDLIIERQPTSHQKRRLISYGAANSGASAETLIDEAMKPHVEQKLIIALGEETRSALARATVAMELEPVDLAEKILQEWLQEQGFIG